MPLTFLDWRRSHHQAIGPIRHRVIPTRLKHLRIADYQQTQQDLTEQIDAMYQAAEDAEPDRGWIRSC